MTQEALKLALEALEKLWSIIDDIDTYSDMAKADEKLYRSLVERRQRKRFEETGITTDGYELSGGAITAIKEALAQTERPADCERCNRLEEQAYDLVGKLRVANIKLSMQPQRTWVGLTDDDELDWEEGSSLKDLVKAIESKLREKNESREWQDLTDDEMLMIYGQKHEGKKYNLGRMVQQALKEKNNV